MPRDAYQLPEDTEGELLDIRDEMIADVDRVLRDYDDGNKRRGQALTVAILAAAALTPSRRAVRVRRLLRDFRIKGGEVLADTIRQAVNEGAKSYAAAHRGVMAKARARAKAKAGGQAITTTERAAILAAPNQGARVALSLADANAALPAGLRASGPFTGDAIAAKARRAGDLRPWKGIDDLSGRLHSQAVRQSSEASRVILQGIKERDSLYNMGRSIVHRLREQRTAFADQATHPKAIRDFLDVGRSLSRRSVEMEQGWQEWQKIRRKIRAQMKRLKPGGTVHTAYLELLQNTAGPMSEKQLERAVNSWGYWKQRYHAERHVRTQVAAAYRANQIRQDAGQPWVIGYTVRMNRVTHAKFVRTKPGRLRKFGGRH